jgi:serine/threonine protein kinase
MTSSFQPGQTVWLETAGERCEIKEFIGRGSRGEVYRVSHQGQDCALKWYHPQAATPELRATIARLVKSGPPNDRFLWPLDVAVCQGIPSFGYLMHGREERFQGLAELMYRALDPTFRTLTTVGLELADSFLRLHALGLCYSDISFATIFFDPDLGEISLCDSDNVVPDGKGTGPVLGTLRFTAPEVIRGEAVPNTNTDLYSLGVILFYLLFGDHPLEGSRERDFACLNLNAMKMLYGIEPLFIFDPKNRENRPVPGIHDNAITFWDFYPVYVQDIFTRAFTHGLRDPKERVHESEWRGVFSRMRDQIFYCHKCGAENFLSDESDLPGPVADQKCWCCSVLMSPPLRLRMGNHTVVLNQDTALYAHHLNANRRNDYTEIMAEMVPHPKRPDVWGLKNVSPQVWTVIPPAGESVEVPSGRSVSLVTGLRIRFGTVEGIVL